MTALGACRCCPFETSSERTQRTGLEPVVVFHAMGPRASCTSRNKLVAEGPRLCVRAGAAWRSLFRPITTRRSPLMNSSSFWRNVWERLRAVGTRAPRGPVERPPPQCKDFLDWDDLTSYDKQYCAQFRLDVVSHLMKQVRKGEIQDPQLRQQIEALWKEITAARQRLRSK